MKIGSFSTDDRVLVIAEIGNNHEGSLDVAERLVREAAAAGADAVKFQTFRTEHFVGRSDAARFDRLKSFELSPAAFARLAELARELGLLFISTPLDMGSVDVLAPLVDAYKIASSDNTFYPLIARVADTGTPLIISSGLSVADDISRTVEFVETRWRERGIAGQLAVLHCITSYPVRPEDANLGALRQMTSTLSVPVGYSDHTLGNEACVLAVALGARIIEKHFTLDHHYSTFRDHQMSAEPAELRDLVSRIRQAELLLGRSERVLASSEKEIEPLVRRSIVAAAPLAKGHALAAADLMWLRPGGGMAPGQEHLLVGRRLTRDVAFGDVLRLDDVE